MQGLEELKNSLFDFTLCDFLMPIMDGLDCVQQYRDWEQIHRPWFRQRIVGISAHASEADAGKGLAAGMDNFMPKPISFKDLASLVENEDQIAASKRLDSITNAPDEKEDYDEPQKKRLKTSDEKGPSESPKKDEKNLLIISPPSLSVHLELVQGTARQCGWQSTTAHSDGDAWNMLKMRTWDMVLVDETYSGFIEEFREWESRKRSDRQGNVLMMSEGKGGGDSKLIVPDGLDGVVGKPLCLNNLKKILRET